MKVKRKRTRNFYTIEYASKAKNSDVGYGAGTMEIESDDRTESIVRALIHEGYRVTITEDSREIEEEVEQHEVSGTGGINAMREHSLARKTFHIMGIHNIIRDEAEKAVSKALSNQDSGDDDEDDDEEE